ncbi:MAG: biopolymer transporter ExbD [Cellvibrionaceae bacterium]|nr:biopolymer transporter ExbD [Cellvibrionaceae bacterium]
MLGSTPFYRKQKHPFSAKLNLVALMDIFTILVFFLLLNSGESEHIHYSHYVALPDSSTGTAPHKELVVLIGERELWFEDRAIAKVADIIDKPDDIIEPLAAALIAFREQKGELSGFEREKGLSVTIMGDRAIPYHLLKSVMTTCRLYDYRNISLAVTQVASPGVLSAGVDNTHTLVGG